MFFLSLALKVMAVTLNADQFERFITEIISRVGAATPPGPTAEYHQKKRIIHDKGFNRVSKFAQGEGAWPEWAFDFKTALGAQSMEMKEYLDVTENQSDIITYKDAVNFDVDRAQKVNFGKMNGELYEILVMMTEGEAKMMVKASSAGDGIQAWSRLHKHYNKRTVARLIRLHREIMNPKKGDMENLVTAIMEWEDKWNRMEVEMDLKNKIPDIWKMGAFLELCPMEVKDLVFQNLNEIGENYKILMQKVVSFVANKVAAKTGPVPMDVGNVETDCLPHLHGEELDVGAVGQNMQCYRCGGWGHASRDCATPKSQGHAGPGGKGGMKGSGKGDGKAAKGGPRHGALGQKGGGKGQKGKGFQGE